MSNLLQVIKSFVVSPAERAQGPDLSHWDVYFRPETATQRIDFVIMKLTEGTMFVDAKIQEIWSGVKQVPIRGGYHYQRSGMSWALQAEHFLNIASKYDFHFHALDIENIGNVYNDAFFADTRRIITFWRAQAPKQTSLIYTNWDTYKQLYAAIVRLYPQDGAAWLASVPFWYAWPSSFLNEPILPIQRNAWDLWQWSWVGKKEEWGTGAAADVNVFNGTPAQMAAWLGMTPQPDPDPEPDPEPEPDPDPIVIRPDITPEPRMWAAEVLPLSRPRVRTYPIVADDTLVLDEFGQSVKVYGGEMFKGKIWSGNDYLWIRIDEYPQRPAVVGKWVAVRRTDGTEKFIKLRLLNESTRPAVTIYRLRKWGDPILVAQSGASIELVPPNSNFQAIGLYNKQTGWGGVSNFLYIPRADIDKLKALQVEDEYEEKKDDWRSQKMNWLCKEKGTIYFTGRDAPGWDVAKLIKWGTIALGNNLVGVEGVEEMLIATRGETKKRWRTMARLAGFRKTDWSLSLPELLGLGLVHRCYCVYGSDNEIGDTPKGIVYSPFWSPLDWDFAGTSQPQAFYVPMDWLLPV
jgi:GH25 family lysozyme M1 (1,4-beta-N-acetylmuramidase)